METTNPTPASDELFGRYGGYTLRRGAHDVTIDGETSIADEHEDLPDGTERVGIPCMPRDGGPLAAVTIDLCAIGPQVVSLPAYVRRLQYDLRILGFKMIREDEATGFFGRVTEWAVREFQIYAGMERVARLRDNVNPALEYVRQLEPVENTRVYNGPVSGELNAETRRCLMHWIENAYRCPVVITARTGRGYADVYDGNGLAAGATADNLWRHDDLQDSAPRVFAVDVTGYYDIPDEVDDNDLMLNGQRHMVLGDYQVLPFDDDYSGPRSIPPNHTWASAEITPETLVGEASETIDGAALSTFRVIRAVSEVECYGFFDSVNAYDNAFISVGPCHWTLGIADPNKVGDGELPGFLAYFRDEHRDPYDAVFSRFGLDIPKSWFDPTEQIANGAQLFDRRQRKYIGSVAKRNGIPSRTFVEEIDGALWTVLQDNEREWNYCKSWMWYYRFMMAGRCSDEYRRQMWAMARIRLRDLLTTTWNNIPEEADWEEETILGEVFTSERAVALLLRWHIRYPNQICDINTGSAVREIFELARENVAELSWTDPPSEWTSEHESALLQAMLDAAEDRSSAFNDTIERVDAWPDYDGRRSRGYTLTDNVEETLSTERNSFLFFDDGLPPSPG